MVDSYQLHTTHKCLHGKKVLFQHSMLSASRVTLPLSRTIVVGLRVKQAVGSIGFHKPFPLLPSSLLRLHMRV
jgi:hypothetical protein